MVYENRVILNEVAVYENRVILNPFARAQGMLCEGSHCTAVNTARWCASLNVTVMFIDFLLLPAGPNLELRIHIWPAKLRAEERQRKGGTVAKPATLEAKWQCGGCDW